MKKETLFGLSLAGIFLAALLGLAVYLALNFRSSCVDAPFRSAESEADKALSSLRESADVYEESAKKAAEAKKAASDERFLIWVGDSRTLGMQKAVSNDNLFIGAAGEGYNWFAAEGLMQLKKALEQYPDTPVIFNFGVNDYDNLPLYLHLYRQLLSDYPDTVFYFLAVNPIDPKRCTNITNEEIADFNAHLKELSPETFIDSYTWMKIEEIETSDGIHYYEDDYRSLYKYVVTQISKKEGGTV